MIRLLTFFGLVISASLLAQMDSTISESTSDLAFEQVYDEPYSIRKLFVGIQPFYGELFATNVNAGFGIDAHYYHKQTADFKFNFRKAYASSFFDLNKSNAKKNSNVENEPTGFNYVEIGMNYHVKDFDTHAKTKMILYKKTYRSGEWAAKVPQRIEVPCRIRKVVGARIGGVMWNSTLDFSNALQQDGKTNLDFGNGDFAENVSIFSNIHSIGLYAGGSMSWIKNIGVTFDEYDGQVDDGILSLFLDILYSPYLKVDDIEYNYTDPQTKIIELRTYNPSILKLNSFGFRAGIDGKFNRKWSWGYGGEVGYRPSVANLGFFANIKISIPLYGTNLEKKQPADTNQ